MPERDPADLAAQLAGKARDDATAVREFANNSQIADSIIGFHAQQAVEKWLKAVMALRGIPQTRIHDLARLADILEENGVEVPLSGDQLDELTRYAVPLRYEDLLDAEPLNRDAALSSVDEVGKWAAAELHPSG
ncbi:MAG TPA: HEPN domain-containing protein [Solirubrobacterales bacterium]